MVFVKGRVKGGKVQKPGWAESRCAVLPSEKLRVRRAPTAPGGSWGSSGYSSQPLWIFEALSKVHLGESPCGERALNSRAMLNKLGTKVTEQLGVLCIIATKKNYVAPGTKCLRILLKQMFAGYWVIQIIVGSLLPGSLPYPFFFLSYFLYSWCAWGVC